MLVSSAIPGSREGETKHGDTRGFGGKASGKVVHMPKKGTGSRSEASKAYQGLTRLIGQKEDRGALVAQAKALTLTRLLK